MIVTNYNCGMVLGKTKIRVKKYRKIGEEGVIFETPQELIGIEGIVEEVWNDAYDTSYPTGYERVHLVVKPININLSEIHSIYHDDFLEDCFMIDLAYVEKI